MIKTNRKENLVTYNLLCGPARKRLRWISFRNPWNDAVISKHCGGCFGTVDGSCRGSSLQLPTQHDYSVRTCTSMEESGINIARNWGCKDVGRTPVLCSLQTWECRAEGGTLNAVDVIGHPFHKPAAGSWPRIWLAFANGFYSGAFLLFWYTRHGL